MKPLEILLPLIKESEGCSLKSYQCPAGIWTIGYGQTGPEVCKGLTWTQANADEHLANTAKTCLMQALHASATLSNESAGRQAAIADFIFNLGVGSYIKSTLKLRVDQGNWMAAKTEIVKWNRANGKVLAGLTIRRNKEAALMG